MKAKSRISKPASHQPIAAPMVHAPIARLLRPLVRLCIRCGMTFPALAELLRELFREGTRPSTEEIAVRIGYDPLDTSALVAETTG